MKTTRPWLMILVTGNVFLYSCSFAQMSAVTSGPAAAQPATSIAVGPDSPSHARIGLPFSIVGFTAQPWEKSSLLEWQSMQAETVDYFEVQYSKDGAGWKSIGRIKTSSDSPVAGSYTFTDVYPAAGTNYYRVMQVDADGEFQYSSILQINMAWNCKAGSRDNHLRHRVLITNLGMQQPYVMVMTPAGKLLEIKYTAQSELAVDLKRFDAGNYLVAISDAAGITQTVAFRKLAVSE